MKSRITMSALLLTIIFTNYSLPQNNLKQIADKAADNLINGKNPLKGLIIGVIKGDKKEIFGYGELVKDKSIKPEETLFDAASITKNFTALLLAQSVAEGLVKYEETALVVEGKNITWQQLATHTSGLPNLPANADHSTGYKKSDLEKFLKECKLDSEPGKKFSYSTAGYSVLGELIAAKRGYKSFDDCLKDNILKPMGFNSSSFNSAGINPACYTGDTLLLKKRKSDYVFNPSGGLICSSEDILRLISINLKPETYPKFTAAVKLTQQVIENVATFMGSTAALGWHYFKGMKCYWNSGVGSQSRCVVMFDPASNCGVILLSNSNMTSDVRLETTGFGLLGQLKMLK